MALNKSWQPCALCGATSVCTHHVFSGTANRTVSSDMGAMVRLCYDCHAQVHADYELRKKLCRKYQRIFERDHSREEFIKLIGRSYL